MLQNFNNNYHQVNQSIKCEPSWWWIGGLVQGERTIKKNYWWLQTLEILFSSFYIENTSYRFIFIIPKPEDISLYI